MFDASAFAKMPFGFWTAVFFAFGCVVGSFLNVCIYRMPRGESVVSPPSHCPHCNYSIPWFLNIPLVTWLWLRGKCANCRAPISPRYFLVELLTGLAFGACWILYGKASPLAALACCLILAGMIAATFIDVEHLIIPDEITFGGMAVGFLCALVAPGTHWDIMRRRFMTQPLPAMRDSFIGIAVGAGVIYGIVRLGKLAFGRYKIQLPEGSKVYFGEESVLLPDEELPYEEIFYRESDAVVFRAERLELVDRCYINVIVKLQPKRLLIGSETIAPDKAPFMEAVTGEMTLPREAMGLGDVKFMGAIGAFLGWPATVFSLGVSAIIGSVLNITLILAGKRDWSSRLPYGPYIAVAAAIWIFGGYKWMKLLSRMNFVDWLLSNEPMLALAPMQDVTDLPFWRVMAQYGGPDIYWTEYFRVHKDSHLESWILESITQNPTGRPVIAQMIGNDIPALRRTALELQQHPVAAIDLNLGCPAPVVYRKCAGGGLLRELPKIDAILSALREAVSIPLTVKTRIGFDSPAIFDDLLALIERHSIDLLTVHGRTVKQMYRPGVRYDLIARAARRLRCPVLANGNVWGADQALEILHDTGARGLMIGRGAIRNPWLFSQIRQRRAGEPITLPTGRDVLNYVRILWEAEITDNVPEVSQVQRMKKFMNFVGEGMEDADSFLHQIRRCSTRADFFRICEESMDHDRPMSLEPRAAEPAPFDSCA